MFRKQRRKTISRRKVQSRVTEYQKELSRKMTKNPRGFISEGVLVDFGQESLAEASRPP